MAHTIDVRRITSGRGLYNIPNIGIFLWRLKAFPLTNSPAFKVDDRHYLFNPLGNNTQLYTRPETEDEITHLAEPINIPMPVSRRVMKKYFSNYYGEDKSIFIESYEDFDKIIICNLTEWPSSLPSGKEVAIDPVLGRIAFAEVPAKTPLVTFHYGFSMEIGGGEYERAETFHHELLKAGGHFILVPDEQATLQQALDVLTENGVIEITDNGCYIFEQPLKKDLAKGQRIEIRSANGRRPTLVLKGDFQINGSDDAEITLNGLLITGGKLQVNGSIKALRIRHCTLVPGIGLKINGDTEHPDDPSIVVKSSETKIEIDHSIVGGLRIDKDASIKISNSIIDAISENKVAYAGIDGISAGGEISIENSTVIGKIHTFLLKVASNTILIADLISGDGWPAPVISERRQEGCVRFSYLPMNSQVPRRYRCQPDLAIQQKIDDSRIKPEFTSLRYDDPGYVQLRMICPVEIRKGAEDESEMGVFHNLYQPQRETNLRVRLDEYLRFGLEAGIFYAS
jgi:hypothetical protein